MIKVKKKSDLAYCRHKYVHVMQEDRVYVRVGSDYIVKPYFTGLEVRAILGGIDRHELHRRCRDRGVISAERRGKRIRLTLSQLRKLL